MTAATASLTSDCRYCNKPIRINARGIWGARKRDDPHPWYCEQPESGRHAPMFNLEVVGVRAAFWAAEVKRELLSVIIPSERLTRTGEDVFELARYLSSGYDDGACDFSPDTGGGTLVRNADTSEILAIYSNGGAVALDGRWAEAHGLTANESEAIMTDPTTERAEQMHSHGSFAVLLSDSDMPRDDKEESE